jgi:ATP-dependent RNA helicase DHX30
MFLKAVLILEKNNLLKRRNLLKTTFAPAHQMTLDKRSIILNTKRHVTTNSNLEFPKLLKSNKLKKIQINKPNLTCRNTCTGYAQNNKICFSFQSENSTAILVNVDKFLRSNQSASCMLSDNNQSNIFSKIVGNSTWKLVNSNRVFSTISHPNDHKNPQDFPSISSNTTSLDRLHAAPKNVLHNVYDVVAREFDNKDLHLKPAYNIVKGKSINHSWCCTYNVKWPESMKFVSVGQTKQEASHKAALSALLWLKKNEKINKDGQPIIISNNEMREIVKQKVETLVLDGSTIDKMKSVANIYENEFVSLLTENVERKGAHDLEDEVGTPDLFAENRKQIKQKLFPPLKYSAKELVSLPISEYKEQFISLLKENRVVVIKGEPGCGKSTRIPQYVLESWAKEGLQEGDPCQIAVTQPRRIAAISLANRVSYERQERCGHIVGFQIRLKSNFNPTTGKILYCTTGILLKHVQSDRHLSNFSHIILDEAHERDVNTDLLLNLLRDTLTVNPNLKLIIMSATVDVDLFRNYLNDAPVMHIPGFTYPVKSYFLNDLDKLDLSKTHNMSCNSQSPTVVHEDVVKVINYIHKTKDEGAILCFLPGWEDIVKVERLLPSTGDVAVLCLHSRLQDSDQQKIFYKPPPGVRKVILSTNIAETSVTIDDVVYVVDTGIHKENRFDNDKGVMCIDNYWISQSSMIQRKGRAGRIQPGESFHLYPKSKYESFSTFTDPEILKTSLTKILLNSKVYSNNMDALQFMSQLPSPPEKNSTRRAVRELKDLQLLDEKENLTALGRTLANFQLEPKLAKVLVNAVVYKCVTPVVDIVTIFSADTELFSTGLVDKQTVKQIKSQGCKHSDHLALMRLFEAWLEIMDENGESTAAEYCADANLIHHKLITVNKLRKLHFDYLHNELHEVLPIADNYSDNDELVKAILYSGVGTLLRHRNWDVVKGRFKKSNVFLNNYNQKASITSESVNFKKTSFPSNLFVYFNEIRSNIRKTTLIRECSIISPLAVFLFSDKDLIYREVEGENNAVILGLKDTKIEYLCSKEGALAVKKCKEAFNSAYWYFIFQLTEGGEHNSHVNEVWDKMLEHINSILMQHSIK